MSTNHGQVKQPARARLYRLLADLGWHKHTELNVAAGNRYCARLRELKREGYVIETRPLQGELGQEYRLQSLDKQAPAKKMVKVYLDPADVNALVNHGNVRGRLKSAIKNAYASYLTNKDKL